MLYLRIVGQRSRVSIPLQSLFPLEWPIRAYVAILARRNLEEMWESHENPDISNVKPKYSISGEEFGGNLKIPESRLWFDFHPRHFVFWIDRYWPILLCPLLKPNQALVFHYQVEIWRNGRRREEGQWKRVLRRKCGHHICFLFSPENQGIKKEKQTSQVFNSTSATSQVFNSTSTTFPVG